MIGEKHDIQYLGQSQFLLGYFSEYGMHLEKDIYQAKEYYNTSKQRENANAFYQLSLLNSDTETNFINLTNAKRLGHPGAIFKIGLKWCEGDQSNYDIAMSCFVEAHNKEHPAASYHLGEIYEKGLYGHQPNSCIATYYFNKARSIGTANLDAYMNHNKFNLLYNDLNK